MYGEGIVDLNHCRQLRETKVYGLHKKQRDKILITLIHRFCLSEHGSVGSSKPEQAVVEAAFGRLRALEFKYIALNQSNTCLVLLLFSFTTFLYF